MDVSVDLARLNDLRHATGMSAQAWHATVLELIEGVADAIDRIAKGAHRADFEAVAHAAHEGRNDALMFGCEALPQTLGRVERAARRMDAVSIDQALAELRRLWPELPPRRALV